MAHLVVNSARSFDEMVGRRVFVVGVGMTKVNCILDGDIFVSLRNVTCYFSKFIFILIVSCILFSCIPKTIYIYAVVGSDSGL